jgi:hypothetical protein
MPMAFVKAVVWIAKVGLKSRGLKWSVMPFSPVITTRFRSPKMTLCERHCLMQIVPPAV